MTNRVVVTGMGVLSPIGNNIKEFTENLKSGISGIKYIPELKDFGFRCQIGGLINYSFEYDEILRNFFLESASKFVKYTIITAHEAFKTANLQFEYDPDSEPDFDTGVIIGSSIGAIDYYINTIYQKVINKEIRKLRSTTTEYSMISAPSAILAGIIGAANYVGFNSSACATGLESIILGYNRIKNGEAKRMITGGVDIYSPYAWAGFEALRILPIDYNDKPTKASRPMSKSASGFVPAEGCGIIILENLEVAIKRNAPIFAEIIGAAINSGGQRNGGSITASNPQGLISCIQNALHSANINAQEIDYISGHLTSTSNDTKEIYCWAKALNRYNEDFPYINALKSLTGHCQSAAGTIETIAAIIQMNENFLHPSLNCEDLHPEIEHIVSHTKIPFFTKSNLYLQTIIKANLGFGDINAVLILKKFNL
ncbi:MAG: beta-ketoacyl-[acyl-carrier-protein] synthase family protein [Bacteroidales bacterium]|nr:beta-ketoacyl-[acyl-carrier-protein] synthase family protein [Bacteroidales bacterium]